MTTTKERAFEGWYTPFYATPFHYFKGLRAVCHAITITSHPVDGYLFKVPLDRVGCQRCKLSLGKQLAQ